MKHGAAMPVGTVARTSAVGFAVAMTVLLSVLLSGCTSTVTGHALRDRNAAPLDVAPLKKSQLADVMLGIDELNSILSSTDMAGD